MKGGILAVGFSLPGLGENREAQDLGLVAGGDPGILVGWTSSSLLECLTDTTGVEPNIIGVVLLLLLVVTSSDRKQFIILSFIILALTMCSFTAGAGDASAGCCC